MMYAQWHAIEWLLEALTKHQLNWPHCCASLMVLVPAYCQHHVTQNVLLPVVLAALADMAGGYSRSQKTNCFQLRKRVHIPMPLAPLPLRTCRCCCSPPPPTPPAAAAAALARSSMRMRCSPMYPLKSSLSVWWSV